MKFLNLSLIFFCSLQFYFISAQELFSIIDENTISNRHQLERNIIPEKYLVIKADLKELQRFLQNTPDIESFSREQKKTEIAIPSPDGSLQVFQIFRTSIMESNLEKKFPSIQTFKGFLVNNPAVRIHFGISQHQFYATVSSGQETYSIDSYSFRNSDYYISYYHKDYDNIDETNNFICSTESKLDHNAIISASRALNETINYRKFRIAIATTGEFSKRYGPSKEDVLSELVKSLNRINQVMTNEFAIELILVDDNDKVIFLDENSDPFPEGISGGALLGQNTDVLNSNIGFANYDIGHVYTIGCNDTGGIAFIRSICAANKGGGVTCHYVNDITAIAVRVAAHEIGHQLGANHTFNNCNGNENSGTAYEPGSGSTIMSYGGLCGPNLNVVGVADDYYHVISHIEIDNYTSTSLVSNCAESIETLNHPPEIFLDFAEGLTIPINTPFELNGVALDEDGDALTYTWEQYNLGPTSLLGTPQGNSPSFRSLYPSSSPHRSFPAIETILDNQNDRNEVLPSYSRDLSFQFVVRDNNLEAGAISWESMDFKSDASAGPFLVEYPNSMDTFQVGQEIQIKWDAANTDNSIINCQAVDILLSTDGGYTFDVILAERTPNDGSEFVFMPNKPGSNSRIKIKASENIFFDISNESFTIKEPDVPGYTVDFSPGYVNNCVPEDIQINFFSEGFLNYDDSIFVRIESDLPASVNLEIEKAGFLPGDSTTALFQFSDPGVSGIFDLNIIIESSSDTLYRNLILDLISADFSDIYASNPANGSSGNSVGQTLTWHPDSDAHEYRIVFGDNPSLDPQKCTFYFETNTLDTFAVLPDILLKSKVYFWTIEGYNNCSVSGIDTLYRFATEALSCNTFEYNDLPKGISPSAALTIEMPIEVFQEGELRDVNIKKLRGSHSWVSELKGELTSPQGTKVLLFDKKCGNQADFNVGFDDQATTDIICPLNQGIFYRPQEKLDTFIGERMEGSWIFELTDKAVGNGGSIQEYLLELCSNAVLEAPELVRNEKLPLPASVGRRINSDFLLTVDSNNDPDELVYTIVRIPEFGTLRLDSDTLEVGDQLSQKDIDNSRLRYQHEGESDGDFFSFIVEDGEGGWIDITEFEIVIDNSIVLNTDDLDLSELNIVPNPNTGNFIIKTDLWKSDFQVFIFDINGRRIGFAENRTSEGINVRFHDRIPGIYFVQLVGDQFEISRKLIIK